MERTRALLTLAALLLAGCATTPLLPWPDAGAVKRGQMGAVLFHLSGRRELPPGARLQSLRVAFKGTGGSHAYTMTEAGGLGDTFSQVLLVTLPQGRYAARVSANAATKQDFWLKLPDPGGRFADIVVKPGRVTVVGALDARIAARARDLVAREDGAAPRGASSLTWDDSVAARAALLQEASGKAQAEINGWRPQLQEAALTLGDEAAPVAAAASRTGKRPKARARPRQKSL